MKTDFRQKQTPIRGYKVSISRDLSKGQSDTRQPDKMSLDTQQKIVNMYADGGNLVLRPGFTKLSDTADMTEGYMHEKGDGNELFVAQINGADRDILKVDRDDGTTASKFTMTGSNDIDFTSLRGRLYATNATDDITAWNGTATSTIALDTGKPKLITNDDSRLWACDNSDDEEILYFSFKRNTGIVVAGDFVIGASTALDRSGIATSKITKYSKLIGSGKYVVAFGENRIEGHRIPSEIITADAFNASVGTLKWELDNIGISQKGSAILIEGIIYFKPEDDYLYTLNPTNGSVKRIGKLEKTMSDIDWSNCQMSYYKNKNILVLNGGRVGDNDATVSYNIETGSFSEFNNIFVNRFMFDQDGVYWIDSERFIQQFSPTNFTDNELPIDWAVLSQADYAGDIEHYKKAFEMFVHVRIFEPIKVLTEVILDRRVYGSTEGQISEFELEAGEDLFTNDPNPAGQGIPQGAMVRFADNIGTETILNSQKINRLFHRIEVQLSGSSKAYFELKGVGLKYFETAKKLKNITYN